MFQPMNNLGFFANQETVFCYFRLEELNLFLNDVVFRCLGKLGEQDWNLNTGEIGRVGSHKPAFNLMQRITKGKLYIFTLYIFVCSKNWVFTTTQAVKNVCIVTKFMQYICVVHFF